MSTSLTFSHGCGVTDTGTTRSHNPMPGRGSAVHSGAKGYLRAVIGSFCGVVGSALVGTLPAVPFVIAFWFSAEAAPDTDNPWVSVWGVLAVASLAGLLVALLVALAWPAVGCCWLCS